MNWLSKILNLKLVITLFLGPLSALAVVDMGSAGYSHTWVDYTLPSSGAEIKVARVYKSRSIYNGLFGFGWCSAFETSLKVLPEDVIKISECGSGQSVLYSVKPVSRASVDASIDKIIEQMKKDPSLKVVSTSYWNQQKTSLLEDEDKRIQLAQKYKLIPELADKVAYKANAVQVESVIWEKAKKQFVRTGADGRIQRFDSLGRLIQQQEPTGVFTKYSYNNDLLVRVDDGGSRFLNISYNEQKKIKEISGVNKLRITYSYSNRGQNLSAVQIASPEASSKAKSVETYSYEYDAYNNLTRAVWPDKTQVSLAYDTQKDWVTQFTGRDQCRETYTYKDSGTTKLHHVAVVNRMCGKKTDSTNAKYEFWYDRRSTGQEVMVRARIESGADFEDVTYDATTGNKTQLKTKEDTIYFEYYDNAQLKSRRSSRLLAEYTYDTKNGAVKTVKLTEYNGKGEVTKAVQSTAQYNTRGQVSSVENSEGKKINLSYDERARVVQVVDQDKVRYNVEYSDRHNLPSKVTATGLGSVTVAYGPNGQITSIQSPQGNSMALKVSSAYEKAMNLLNPVTRVLYR
ncbi:DUF6531 domain-containing protein [Pseudobdellovibrio exovorus]|uniref:DUF6531 domain-containing protein n=1 Tax=Pseudobdellovibrio exovorus JSS TaxID=1184267 RepID=M4VT88_9BACT|nr:DUF6531 domain-containing protein [Pseudobdellovibrio exovorus]AGH96424.1 hypothetical protein A11Q_2208 [Pseudobdellovibrio exovorus JSS]